ncbi:MAG: hypothetical protein IK053_00450, partial [Muribaculaceae bacterium]|nr:hypothetical protein [Muribaculaceae bacterium]
MITFATTDKKLSSAVKVLLLLVVMVQADCLFAQSPEKPTRRYDPAYKLALDSLEVDSLDIDFLGIDVLMPEQKAIADSLRAAAIADSLAHVDIWAENYSTHTFSPDPTRAVWMSALVPGLGQIYNRRFWKVPIVIGGFMGLS